MTIAELKARKKELRARKKELEAQANGEGDDLSLCLIEEELLEIKAQIRALSPGVRSGSKQRSAQGNDCNFDRVQFQTWREADQDSSEDDADTHAIMKGVLADSRHLMTSRQWEMFELWTAGGLTAEKIRELLGLNKSTVSRTLGCAKAKLQKKVALRDLVKTDLDETGLDMSDPTICAAVMSCITETQVVYLYLRFGEHLSCRKIAAMLGRYPSTVTRAVQRAQARIGRELEVSHICLKNMDALSEVAYQIYVSNNDSAQVDPGNFPGHKCWGRRVLQKSSLSKSRRALKAEN